MSFKILKTILIAAGIVILLAGILYAAGGSLEMFPTDEQLETERIAAFMMIISGTVIGTAGLLLKPKKK